MHHWLYLLSHVVILILYLHGATTRIFHISLATEMFDLALAALESGATVVADDVAEHCLLH